LDDPGSSGIYVVLLLLLGLSAWLSASETALFGLGPVRLRRLLAASDRSGARLADLMGNAHDALTTLLLGNTTVNIVFSALVTTLLLGRLQHRARHEVELLAVGVSTTVILFFGEVFPKSLAERNPEALARAVSAPVTCLVRVLSRLVGVINSVTLRVVRRLGVDPKHIRYSISAETLQAAVELGRAAGTLEAEEGAMIQGIFECEETLVREIMTPRTDLVAVPATATVAEVLGTILSSGYSRIPVYEGNLDHLTGAVHAKDLLPLVIEHRLDAGIAGLVRPVSLVPETTRACDLLHELRHQSGQLAVVLDEYGGTAGIVTLEDVVEEIVGDIHDEFDRDEELVRTVDGGYEVAARLPVEDVNELLGLELPVLDEVDSLGGLVLSLIGRLPRVGESTSCDAAELTVAEVKGRRITKVRVLPRGEVRT
jgi:CBS domain containing-hemolysin-like protein